MCVVILGKYKSCTVTAHEDSAILIETSIRHVQAEKYEYDDIQATTITLDDEDGKLTISTIYKNIT